MNLTLRITAVVILLLLVATALAGMPAAAANASLTPPATVRYGETFTITYTGKAAYVYADCGFWNAYGRPVSAGVMGYLSLDSVTGRDGWPTTPTVCTATLLDKQGRVTASAAFTASP